MAKTKPIIIIGTGQIGSRHLQALKAVKFPLEIYVVDRSEESLRIAKERYNAMPAGKIHHPIEYLRDLPKNKNYDIGIVATTSGPRAALTKKLLSNARVRYLILEKLLFSERNDYANIGRLIRAKKVKTWVNCPMRMMPFYKNLKKEFSNQNITYVLHGNQSGLATDLIHHLDYMAYLTGSKEFSLDTHLLDKKIKKSKRKGYLEITGTMLAEFKNGSLGIFRCDAKESSLKTIEIINSRRRYLFKEDEGEAQVPYQSQLTTMLVEDLIETGKCELPAYEESTKLHLQMLEPIRKYFKFNNYPFT